jgi:hypothetical protein
MISTDVALLLLQLIIIIICNLSFSSSRRLILRVSEFGLQVVINVLIVDFKEIFTSLLWNNATI